MSTRDKSAIPARLERLAFQGWRDKTTSIAFIIPPMCQVPASTFTMGSDPSDPQAYPGDKGLYSIFVDTFAIGTYPVTVAEYALAVQAGAVSRPQDPPDNGSPGAPWRDKYLTWELQKEQRADHPVVCVSWQEARAYCRWLAQVSGQPWRLPSEAEWEKAARWDATHNHARIYPWGDHWDKTRTNTHEEGPRITTPVGAYAEQGDASPYGCHDMAGNVWEWANDAWYPNQPYDASKHENDADTWRVLRGGSWRSPPGNVRAACRIGMKWDVGDRAVGFRLARSERAGTE